MTQGSNLGLPHCRQGALPSEPAGKPKIHESESHSVVSDSLQPHDYKVHGILQARNLEWIAIPFSRGSSRPRDGTQVSCIAGRFFTVRPPVKQSFLKVLPQFSSVQFSRSVLSDSLQPHEPRHSRPPCPSPIPGVYPNPCPLSW